MISDSADWQNDLWTKKYDVDPERTAIAVAAIPSSSASKKLRELEDAMRRVSARVNGLPLSASVHVDENSLPHARTLKRWANEETPPDPQSACLIVALLDLTGVNISLIGLGETNVTDFARRTSISVVTSGPLNIQGENGEPLTELHSLDFRSYEIREEIKDPEEGVPQKVILSFDELTFHLNAKNSEIDRTRGVLNIPEGAQDESASSQLRITFSGFPESSWVVDAKDRGSAINGFISLPGTVLCTLMGELTPACSLRVLCRAENLTVEPLTGSTPISKLTPQDHFRNKLIANIVRDDLYRHTGYHLLKEQPILGGENGN